jgi:phosphoribosyl-AMP cyclohydrolase
LQDGHLSRRTSGGRKRENQMDITPTIDFNKMDGLVPAIVQDDATGEILMLGFMNP